MPLRYLLPLCFPAAILAFSFQSCHHGGDEVAPADTLIFIMAGQSNMAGRGTVAPSDTVTHPRILEMDDTGGLSPKREPNTYCQGALAGLDCGQSFGRELLARLPSSTTIILVQCSIGSTSIQDWLGDSLRVVHLYSHILHRAALAARYGTLKGILWHQGEANAESQTASEYYSRDLSAFIQNLRTDLAAPSLSFYIGLLPSWCIRPYTSTVNAHIATTAATLPSVYTVPTSDLPAKPDSLHLEAPGQRELGKRFAQAALSHW